MNTPHKQLINLLKGWPSLTLLPTNILTQASTTAFSNTNTAFPALCYGPDPGYEPLRKAIAQWLTRFYAPSSARSVSQSGTNTSSSTVATIDSDRICITGGASQNMACMLQVFTDPVYTRNVWCISPMYFLAGRIFEDNGFASRLRAVPEDEEGIDLGVLEAGLAASEKQVQSESQDDQQRKLKILRPWNKFYRHVIYAVPTFSNPSSKTMSLRRREGLVRLARRYDALIITDDVYDQLQWHPDVALIADIPKQAVQPRLVDVDRFLDGGSSDFGNAVSNGSFSKIVGPGVRTGWAEGTEKFAYGLSQCGSSRSGGSPSQAMGVVLIDIVNSGKLDDHISNTLQPAYAKRYALMMTWIENLLLPLGVVLPQGERTIVGGYFIWLVLPKPFNADGVARRAKVEENLILGPGSFFVVPGDEKHDDTLDRAIRVCLAWEDEDLLKDGIQRLADVVRRMIDEGDNGDTGEAAVISATGI